MMTPARTGGKRGGNFELELTLCGIAIRRSAETADRKKFDRIVDILRKLAADDRVDVLTAFALPRAHPGRISIAELVESDRRGKPASSLQAMKLRAPLWDRVVGARVEPGAVSRAFGRMPVGHTRNRYIQSFTMLERKAARWLPVDATVGDLMVLPWETLAAEWGGSGTDWMHLKRALSRFITLHMADKWDEFARKLRQRIPTKRERKRRPLLSITQFKAIAERMPAHAALVVWFLVVTGVRLEEFENTKPEHLNDELHTYLVPGADKNEVGDFPLGIDPRWWSYVKAAVTGRRIARSTLRQHWKNACRLEGIVGGRRGITLHDLRHCHGQWYINAGGQESKAQASLRHENPGQTRDYVMQFATGEVSRALYDALQPSTETPNRRRA